MLHRGRSSAARQTGLQHVFKQRATMVSEVSMKFDKYQPRRYNIEDTFNWNAASAYDATCLVQGVVVSVLTHAE